MANNNIVEWPSDLNSDFFETKNSPSQKIFPGRNRGINHCVETIGCKLAEFVWLSYKSKSCVEQVAHDAALRAPQLRLSNEFTIKRDFFCPSISVTRLLFRERMYSSQLSTIAYSLNSPLRSVSNMIFLFSCLIVRETRKCIGKWCYCFHPTFEIYLYLFLFVSVKCILWYYKRWSELGR